MKKKILKSTDLCEYDPFYHTYKINGIEVPSVTSVIPYESFVSEQVLERAKEEGKANHHALHIFRSQGRILPGYEDYIENYQCFVADYRKVLGKLVQSETPLFDPRLMYAGTPDEVYEHGIVDIKRSMGNVANYSLQLGGYMQLTVVNKIIGYKDNHLIAIFRKEKIKGKERPYKVKNVYNPRSSTVLELMIQKHWIEKDIAQYYLKPKKGKEE